MAVMVGASSKIVESRTIKLIMYFGTKGFDKLAAVCTQVTAPIKEETIETMSRELIPIS
jgi:hypothetical protein